MDTLKDKFKDIKIVKYRFFMQAEDEVKMDRGTNNSLRRDFIPLFKQITCKANNGPCDDCQLGQDCPYFVVFESANLPLDPKNKRFQTPPKPFIFEPSLTQKTYFSRDEEFTLDLILIGEAISYFPYFIAALHALGKDGIGFSGGRFFIKNVVPFDLFENYVSGNYIWNPDSPTSDDATFSLGELYEKYRGEYKEIKEIQVNLVTPLRMKRLGTEDWHLHFRGVLRNVLTRVANLAYRYCGYEDFMEFPEILYKSGVVRTISEKFHQEDKKSSFTQRVDVRKTGSLGNIVYRGNITEFWGIVRLAELLHLGKNTSFGFGRIVVEPHEITSIPAE